MNLGQFKKLPLIGILRGIKLNQLDGLIEAAVASGLGALEVTMNTEDAPSLIKRAAGLAKGRLAIGAGTVLTKQNLQAALSAGASFIVSPTTIEDIVNYCFKNSIPVFPGALTPSEIERAWSLGATMIKVFPARVFGPAYFKEIKGPFPEIELLACGGVNPENISEFFAQGASAAAFGSSIFRNDWLENKQFSKITEAIKELISHLER